MKRPARVQPGRSARSQLPRSSWPPVLATTPPTTPPTLLKHKRPKPQAPNPYMFGYVSPLRAYMHIHTLGQTHLSTVGGGSSGYGLTWVRPPRPLYARTGFAHALWLSWALLGSPGLSCQDIRISQSPGRYGRIVGYPIPLGGMGR